MTDFHPPWRVLVICGSSGSGKTTVGRRLAERFGISLVLADDVRMAIQAVTTAQEQPSLHTFTVAQSPAMDSPDSVLAGLVTVAEALEPALRMIMAHHLVVEGVGAIILEGDGLLPRLANPAYLEGRPEFINIDVEGSDLRLRSLGEGIPCRSDKGPSSTKRSRAGWVNWAFYRPKTRPVCA